MRITDDLEATALTGRVAEESFETIAGPSYGVLRRLGRALAPRSDSTEAAAV